MENKKKTSKVAMVLLIILAILIMYGIPIALGIWGVFSENVEFEEKNNKIIVNNKDIVISDIISYYDEENNIYYVEGFLKNNDEDVCNYLYITFNVYDANGNVLGEASANINSLASKDTWKFKARYEENDAKYATNYKFTSIEFY